MTYHSKKQCPICKRDVLTVDGVFVTHGNINTDFKTFADKKYCEMSNRKVI